MASFCEGRRFYIIKGDWNDAFLEELTSFDGSGTGFDDQVDSTVNAFNLLMRTNREAWNGEQWTKVFSRRGTQVKGLRDITELLKAKMTGRYHSPVDQLFPDGYPGDESEN